MSVSFFASCDDSATERKQCPSLEEALAEAASMVLFGWWCQAAWVEDEMGNILYSSNSPEISAAISTLCREREMSVLFASIMID